MEAVQASADVRVVRQVHDPHGVFEIVDERTPGQCLVGDADAVTGGEVAEPTKLGSGEFVVVDRGGTDIAAEQH